MRAVGDDWLMVVSAMIERLPTIVDPWETYDVVCSIAGEAASAADDSELAGSIYVFFAELSDFYDLSLVPIEAVDSVARELSLEWTSTPAERLAELVSGWWDRGLDARFVSLGHEIRQPVPRELTEPWRGRWDDIAWSIEQIGRLQNVRVGAERVLRNLGEEPQLWTAGRGAELRALVDRLRAGQEHRAVVEEKILELLGSLSAGQVPPLQPS